MKKQQAQSLTEYGIVLSLVAVLAIPTLMLTGNSIGSGLSSLLPGGSNLQTAKAATNAKSGTGDTLEAKSEQSFQSTIDPKTGNITYKLPESAGGGSHTTSVDGATAEISDALTQLAKNWRDSQNQPMDDSLKQAILDTAKIGYDVAKTQAPGMEYELFRHSDDFAKQYKTLNSQLAALTQKGPEYAQLQSTISGYTGIITYTNYSNFLNPSISDNRSSQDTTIAVKIPTTSSTSAGETIYYNSAELLAGVQPEIVVGKEEANDATNAAATGIESTAK